MTTPLAAGLDAAGACPCGKDYRHCCVEAGIRAALRRAHLDAMSDDTPMVAAHQTSRPIRRGTEPGR